MSEKRLQEIRKRSDVIIARLRILKSYIKPNIKLIVTWHNEAEKLGVEHEALMDEGDELEKVNNKSITGFKKEGNNSFQKSGPL